jgi:hypothetical protein
MENEGWEFVNHEGDVFDIPCNVVTCRLKVQGGWLYNTTHQYRVGGFGGALTTSLAFVPDPDEIAAAPQPGHGVRVRCRPKDG